MMFNRIVNKLIRTMRPIVTFNKKGKFEDVCKLIDFSKYSKVIIFENSFGWNGIMKQRPQQIAEHMPDDVLFLYHSNRDRYDNGICCKRVKSNLYIIDNDLYRNFIVNLSGNFYVMVYSTNFVKRSIIDKYSASGFGIIYEYVDDINIELMGKRTYSLLKSQYDYVMSKSNVFVACTASKLYDNVKSAKKRLITNGVDYDHFCCKKREVPSDMKRIIDFGKPIIGYYGALASWFDYDLIKEISETSLYSIVLIGLDYDKTLDSSGVLELENVFYLGKKDYSILPSYLDCFSVAMIPFIINEITLSTSPVKVFEYMADLKPIVTTGLPECKKYKSVFVSSSHKEFISNLKKANSLAKDKKYLDILKSDSISNTWDSKCLEMIDFIEEE